MTLGLAISILGLIAASSALVATAHLSYLHRRTLRREWICLVGMQQISDALEARDGESAIGALLEWDRAYTHEVEMQDAQSRFRFWEFPPELGEDWK